MQKSYPQKPKVEEILKQAFGYWSRTLSYQLAFSILYFSIFFIVVYYFSERFGILEQYTAAIQKNPQDFMALQSDVFKIQSSSEYRNLNWIVLATLVFLYPLNLGFYKIYRKLDLKEVPTLSDLFSGYAGANFFMYTSYYLFWILIFSTGISTIILGIVWVFVTLFVAPLMFFQNKRSLEGIVLTIKALRTHFIEIFVGIFVAFFFKYAGLLFFGVGFLITYPFSNAILYSLYSSIFAKDEEIPKK